MNAGIGTLALLRDDPHAPAVMPSRAPDGYVAVVYTPAPWRVRERRRVHVPVGMTIAEILTDELELALDGSDVEGLGRASDMRLRVTLGYAELPPDTWSATLPRSGDLVTVRRVPTGPFAPAIQAIAVALGELSFFALAPLIGPTAAVGVANFVLAAVPTLIQAGIAFGVSAALNSIASPGNQSGVGAIEKSPTINRLKNQSFPYGPYWRVFGKRRIAPGYLAEPYLESAGTDLVYSVVFAVGRGPHKIENVKVGDNDFDDLGQQFTNSQIEIRNGFPGDAPYTVALRPIAVTGLNIPIWEKISGGITGDKVQTTPVGTRRVKVTLAFPAGFYLATERFTPNDMLEFFNATPYVNFGVSYSVVGAATWVAPTEVELFGVGAASHRVEPFYDAHIFLPTETRVPGFMDIEFDLPSADEWDIRVAATITPNPGLHPKLQMDTTWIQLVSFTEDSFSALDQVAGIGMRLQATNTSQGNVENVTAEVTGIHPYYDGAAWQTPTAGDGPDWTPFTTSNPAWAYAEALTGLACPRPQPFAKLDHDRLKFWADMADDPAGDASEPAWTCDAVADYFGTVQEILENICRTGQASLATRDGLFSVVIDYDRSAESPVTVISPRNTEEFSYRGQIIFADQPHAVRVAFQNADADWNDDELIEYQTGYAAVAGGGDLAAEKFAELDGARWGITNPDRVRQFARYYLAASIYRTHSIQVRTDFEHLALERGDVVELCYDVPLFGLTAADVKSITVSGPNVTHLQLDEEVVFENGKSYGVTWRNEAGNVRRSEPVNNPAPGPPGTLLTATEVELTTPLATADTTAPAAGTRPLSFGELGEETRTMLVRSKRPREAFAAELDFIPLSPELFAALGDAIPSHTTPITIPSDWKPPPPTIIAARVVEGVIEVTLRSTDEAQRSPLPSHFEGQFQHLVVTPEEAVDVAELPPRPTAWIAVPNVPAAGLQVIRFGPVHTGRLYAFRVRTAASQFRGRTGTSSDWVLVSPFEITDDGVVIAPSIEVSQLQWLGQAGADTIDGPDFVATFDVRAADLFPDPLQDDSNQGGAIGALERLGDVEFVVRWRRSNGALLREEVTKERRVAYTYRQNAFDNARPVRSVLLEIGVRVDGILRHTASIAGTNPAPATPVILEATNTGSAIVLKVATAFRDTDYGGLAVWLSSSSGFTPTEGNRVHLGGLEAATEGIRIAVEPRSTYYYRVGAWDGFSKRAADLNLTAEQTITTRGVRTPEIDNASFANLIPDPLHELAADEGKGDGDEVTDRWWVRDDGGTAPTWTYESSIGPGSPQFGTALAIHAELSAAPSAHPRIAGPALGAGCSPGESFLLEYDAAATAGAATGIKGLFRWLDEAGAELSVTLQDNPWNEAAASNTYETFTFEASAPTDAVYVQAGVQIAKSGPEWSLDNIRLRRMVDSLVIEDAAIVNAKIGDLEVDNAKIANATIENAKIVANEIRADRILRGRADNLIQDPGFEALALADWGSASGGGGITWAINGDQVRKGSFSLEGTSAGATHTTDARVIANGPDPTNLHGQPVAFEGQQHYFEFYTRYAGTAPTTDCVRAAIRYYDEDGSQVGSDTESALHVDTTSWELVMVNATAPADASYVVFLIVLEPNTLSGTTYHFDTLYASGVVRTEQILENAVTTFDTDSGSSTINGPSISIPGTTAVTVVEVAGPAVDSGFVFVTGSVEVWIENEHGSFSTDVSGYIDVWIRREGGARVSPKQRITVGEPNTLTGETIAAATERLLGEVSIQSIDDDPTASGGDGVYEMVSDFTLRSVTSGVTVRARYKNAYELGVVNFKR